MPIKHLFVLLLLPWAVGAQVKHGDVYTLEKNETVFGLFQGSGQKTLLLKTVRNSKNEQPDWVLETFDESLEKGPSSSIPAPVWNGAKAEALNIFQGKDLAVTAFWYAYDNGKNKHQILWSKLDEKGTLAPLYLAAEFDGHEKDDATFAILPSADESKWLIRKPAVDKKTGTDVLTACVLDAGMNTLWKSDLNYPYASDKTLVETFSVDNQGRVLYFFSSDTDVKNKSNESVRQEVLVYKGASKPVQTIRLTTGGQLLLEPVFMETAGKVWVAGLYTNGSYKKDYFGNVAVGRMGAYHVILDPGSGKAGDILYTPFNDGTFTYFQVKPKDVNDGIYPLRFRSLLPASDGGFWMCLQEGGRTSYEAGNKWRSMYEAGPMLVFHFDEAGKFMTETYVHKAIVSSDDPSGVGYILMEENDKLHLVYNNASKNWNVKAKKHTDLWFGHTPQSTYKGTNKDTDVVYTVIGADGKAASKKIIDVNKDAYFLPYLEVVQPRNDAVFMLTGNDDRYRLTKLTLAH